MTHPHIEDRERFREWAIELLGLTADAAMLVAADDRIVLANERAHELLGGDPTDRLLGDAIDGRDTLWARCLTGLLETEDAPPSLEVTDRDDDGTFATVRLRTCVDDSGHRLGRIIHVATGGQEAAPPTNPTLASSILNHVGSLVLVADADGKVVYASPSITVQLGYTPGEILGDRWFEITRPSREEGEAEQEMIRAAALDSSLLETAPYERRVLDRNGDPHWILWQDAPGPGNTVIGIGSDITDRKLYGGISGLPTRELFLELVARRIADVEGSGPRQALGVIAIDLDRFDAIIQAFGAVEADSLLARIADRVRSRLDRGDTLAHLGGDKFAVLLEHEADRLGLSAHARVLRSCFERPFRVAGSEIFLSASLGMVADVTADDPAEVLRQAQTAAAHAKATGRGRAELFRADMTALSAASLQLEADLRRSLELDQLVLEYQPIYALDSLRVAGFEALLRWNHPNLGRVSPDRFIPVAEDTGTIIPIGRWVVRQACAQLRSWVDSDPRAQDLFVAVNISADQLQDHQLTSVILESLRHHDLRPEQLILEITESSLMAKSEIASRLIAELRASGVRWSIDDFGTGYSSLSQLSSLPVDNLKIDRSFVLGMLEDRGRRTIVEAVVRLGHSLSLELVAEGIERGDQLEVLRQLGCEQGQGYLMSAPVSAEAATALITGSD